jgi:uncharacterized protein (DUF1499 family)
MAPAGYGVWYWVAKLTGAPLDIGPVDWATLRRRPSRNDALVCPAGLCPNAVPEHEAKTYAVLPDALLARLTAIILADPRTRALSAEPGRARFIQVTRMMRYPDTIDAQVFAADGGSTLAVYSRSLVGRKDFGANPARVARWMAKLNATAP